MGRPKNIKKLDLEPSEAKLWFERMNILWIDYMERKEKDELNKRQSDEFYRILEGRK